MKSNIMAVWITQFGVWIIYVLTMNKITLAESKKKSYVYWGDEASPQERDFAFHALYLVFFLSGVAILIVTGSLWLLEVLSTPMTAVPSILTFMLLLLGNYFIIRGLPASRYVTSLGNKKFVVSARSQDTVSNTEFMIIVPIALFLGYLIQIWISNAVLS